MSILTTKKILVVSGLILMLFISLMVSSRLKQNNLLPTITPISSVVLENNMVVNKSNSEINLVKVVRVIDGDTIEIEGGEKVRYIGIDAPETSDLRKLVQCFGVEAFRKNKELVEGKMVRLERDVVDRDKYGRLLRYVWLADIFVNLELVRQGFAYSYTYPPNIKNQEQFIKAQQEARETKQGLWSSCLTNQEQSVISIILAKDSFLLNKTGIIGD